MSKLTVLFLGTDLAQAPPAPTPADGRLFLQAEFDGLGSDAQVKIASIAGLLGQDVANGKFSASDGISLLATAGYIPGELAAKLILVEPAAEAFLHAKQHDFWGSLQFALILASAFRPNPS